MSGQALRERLIRRWWDIWPSKPVKLQNGVSRILCWRYGHERGRTDWCDWCGKDMTTQ